MASFLNCSVAPSLFLSSGEIPERLLLMSSERLSLAALLQADQLGGDGHLHLWIEDFSTQRFERVVFLAGGRSPHLPARRESGRFIHWSRRRSARERLALQRRHPPVQPADLARHLPHRRLYRRRQCPHARIQRDDVDAIV